MFTSSLTEVLSGSPPEIFSGSPTAMFSNWGALWFSNSDFLWFSNWDVLQPRCSLVLQLGCSLVLQLRCFTSLWLPLDIWITCLEPKILVSLRWSQIPILWQSADSPSPTENIKIFIACLLRGSQGQSFSSRHYIYGIYRDGSKNPICALGEHDPESAQDGRTSSEM